MQKKEEVKKISKEFIKKPSYNKKKGEEVIKLSPEILKSPTYSFILKEESKLSKQLKKKFYNFNFHETNEVFCYNYSSCFKKDGNKSSEYIVKIISKLPINNIMKYIYNSSNNNKFENIVILKKKYIDDYKYSRCIFTNNASFVKCTISSIMRQLDKKIKKNMLEKIKLEKIKFEREQQPLEFSKYNNEKYIEYFKNYPPFTHNVEECISKPIEFEEFENKFDYNDFLKNDYIYYYCLYKYIFLSKILFNRESYTYADGSINYINLISIINNNNFINFMTEEKKKFDTKIDTIEEYMKKIYKLDPDQIYQRFNFIKNTNDFIYLPDYTNIVSINDIIDIYMYEDRQEFVRYNNFMLMAIYKYKYNINNIFDIGYLIETDNNLYGKISYMLQNNKYNIKNYFKDKLQFEEPPIDETIIEIPGIEKIIIDSHIHIWTNIDSTNKFFHFNAEFKPDGYNRISVNWVSKSIVYLQDFEEYLRLGIINKMDFYIYEKKKNLPFYYYDLNYIKGWFSYDIDDNIRDFFSSYSEEFIQDSTFREDFEKYRAEKSIPYDDLSMENEIDSKESFGDNESLKNKNDKKELSNSKKYKIIKSLENRSCNNTFYKIKDEKPLPIKESQDYDNKDKINLHNRDFMDIDRKELIPKLKEIFWSGTITRVDCHIKIYGIKKSKEQGNGEHYLLYIVPKKIKNYEIDEILNFHMKEIMENMYIFNNEYVLYLHKIDICIIRDYTEEMDITLRHDFLYQPKDNKIRKTVCVKFDHELKNLLNIYSLNKIINDLDKIGENLNSEAIFKNKHIAAYQTKIYEVFPDFLVKPREDSVYTGIFDYIRFLMIVDDNYNSKLYNSFQSKKLKNQTGILRRREDFPNYCPIVFFISLDNMLRNFNLDNMLKKYFFKTPHTESEYTELTKKTLLDDLYKDPLLTELIKDMIIDVYKRRDRFILVGYLLQWRSEKILNILDLIDSDYNYLKQLISNSKKCIIEYINNLKIEFIEIDKDNIEKTIIFEINEDNFETIIHFPSGNTEIHCHFQIYKKPVNNYLNRNINYYTQSNFTDVQVLNFLSLNIQFFNNINFSRIILITTLKGILETSSGKKYAITQSENMEDEIINHEFFTDMVGGKNKDTNDKIIGGDYNKFKIWIDKYMQFDNIFKIYPVPNIIMNFEIYETKKPIRNKILYKKLTNNCVDINNYDTIKNNFYIHFDREYFNINSNEYKKKFTEKLLFKKFDNIMNITRNFKISEGFYSSNTDNFYVNDSFIFIDYKKEYDKMLYDYININNMFDIFNINTLYKVYSLFLKKNIISLIWSLKHLNVNGCILFTIREFLKPAPYDLLLLLQNFASIFIYYDYSIISATVNNLLIICYDFKDIDILIKHLEKILTFDLINDNTSFIKIKKIIEGDIDKFNKITLKVSNFILNRILDYVDCFKNNKNNLEIMNPEIENLIKTKAILFLSQNYTPRPDHLPYILSLLKFKKIKIGNEYIDIEKNITQKEGELFYELIKNINATHILEIGMSYGLSSLYILQSLKYFNNKYNKNNDYSLTSIDPVQTSEWNNIGIENLKNAGLKEHHKLIEKKSYLALSKLIDKEKSYDIVFINGWLMFDYIAYDIFGSYILLKKNGYLVINNIKYPGIDKTIKFIKENYKYLKKINTNVNTIVVYLKLNDDGDKKK